MEQQYIEYAAIILVIVTFCMSYKIFVTPKQMDEEIDKVKNQLKSDYNSKFDKIKDDYVQKEVHDLAINEIKEDLKEVKQDVKDMKNILIQKTQNI